MRGKRLVEGRREKDGTGFRAEITRKDGSMRGIGESGSATAPPPSGGNLYSEKSRGLGLAVGGTERGIARVATPRMPFRQEGRLDSRA